MTVLPISPVARTDLPGQRFTFGAERPMRLDSGVELGPFTVAYQTYGTLNRERSNAILLCHALSGDQFAAEIHPLTGKPGWWEFAVGPGLPFDTDRYFVICSNVLGGCMGTTGPKEINPPRSTACARDSRPEHVTKCCSASPARERRSPWPTWWRG